MSNYEKPASSGKGIGGQAVIEGVMMRGKKMYSLAVRDPQKKIQIEKTPIGSTTAKYPFLKLPLIRGVVAFISSLVIGIKVTQRSAEMAGLDDVEYDQNSKFEMWLEKHFGDKLTDYIMIFSLVLSLALCIGIFSVLPTFISDFIVKPFGGGAVLRSITEGIVRIIIFICYLLIIAQMKDIKRTFMYHGAEHKTINCFENDKELTVENVKKQSRFHKRCGTSFLMLVMIVSMVVFFFVRTKIIWLRVLSRVLLLPVISGISYELIKWAGSHENKLVDIISAPGICMQLITTKEPDESMIEVAIASLKAVLEEEPEEKKA
ncbi:MAG TPA: DUF1385 domain-containing protein [Lachnospiraceae bacterium]|nr:DUF1385 domain-containing protein [Lachnospiraceae bacterium]